MSNIEHWGLMTGGLDERPEFMGYAGRLRERPALARVFARDAELAAKMQG